MNVQPMNRREYERRTGHRKYQSHIVIPQSTIREWIRLLESDGINSKKAVKDALKGMVE